VPHLRRWLANVKTRESQPIFFGRVLFEDCEDLERVALLLLSVAKMFHPIRALEVSTRWNEDEKRLPGLFLKSRFISIRLRGDCDIRSSRFFDHGKHPHRIA
jgi:hypothetical protein